jgi:signal transduction histidine kinase
LEADRLLITVKDTGVGIDVEEMPLIYDRFYRGRGHKIEGSGLGLAIVKSVVEAHGGHVELESVVGVGSQFTLIFPHNN